MHPSHPCKNSLVTAKNTLAISFTNTILSIPVATVHSQATLVEIHITRIIIMLYTYPILLEMKTKSSTRDKMAQRDILETVHSHLSYMLTGSVHILGSRLSSLIHSHVAHQNKPKTDISLNHNPKSVNNAK